jgi:hypothetical protein
METIAILIADLVAAAHIGYFIFVVVGTLAIVAGGWKHWKWIRNPWFRFGHVTAAAIVVIEDVFKLQCPLNTIEWNLRTSAGSAKEAAAGAGALLDQLLRHTLPGTVVHATYWSLGALLVVLLFVVPPRLPSWLDSAHRM